MILYEDPPVEGEVQAEEPAVITDGPGITYHVPERDFPRAIHDNMEDLKKDPRYSDEKTNPGSLPLYRCTGSALDACYYNWRKGWDKLAFPEWAYEKDRNQSVDAWEFHRFTREHGLGLAGELLHPNNYPLNTIVGTGLAKNKYLYDVPQSQGLPRHSQALIGWLPDGQSIWYSIGNIEPLGEVIKRGITQVTTPANLNYTYEKAIADEEAYQEYISRYDAEPLYLDINSFVSNLEASGLEVSSKFKSDLTEFNDMIVSSRDRLMKLSGLTGEGFNELHKQAIALAAQETGTSGYLVRFIDDLGKSKGITQVRGDMVASLKKLYPEIMEWDTETFQHFFPGNTVTAKSSALYTMMLLADNAKRLGSVRKMAESKGPGEITEANRKYSGFARKIISVLDLDSYKETYPTSGYTNDLSNSEILSYMYNNPLRLRAGDAQGAETNTYVSNVEKYKGFLEPRL